MTATEITRRANRVSALVHLIMVCKNPQPFIDILHFILTGGNGKGGGEAVATA